MKFSRMLRLRKSHSLMWVSYFLTFMTLLSFLVVFTVFFAKGLFSLLAGIGYAKALPVVIWSTIKVFGVAYLWAVPWAFLLTVFLWQHQGTSGEALVGRLLKIYLRTPLIVVGIFVIYVFYNFSVTSSLSLLVGFLALPRLVNGWLHILSGTPTQLREAGLAVGMTFWQIFYRLYLVQYWPAFVEHLLKVTGVLAGAVAPFVYLTSFSFLSEKPLAFLSLEIFREMVKGNDGSPFVWAAITILSIVIVVLTMLEEYRGLEESYYG